MEDKADMSFLTLLMDSIRRCAQTTRFNKKQCKLLADRCGAIHRTLTMMHHTTPSPNVLSAFRSAEFLMRRHVSDGWTLLTHRFTATELFDSVREKLRLVWSLQSTARWESEDNEAVNEDTIANVHLIRELKLQLPGHDIDTVDDDVIISFFHRQRISGWKMHWNTLEKIWVRPNGSITPPPAVLTSSQLEERNAEKLARHFTPVPRFACHPNPPQPDADIKLYSHGIPVVCFQLTNTAAITPRTLEAFVIDMKCRYSWCHPNLVSCVGGYAERFDEDDDPYLSLGAIVEDIRERGFISLHELLYEKGRRFALTTALGIILRVADALQYALFSSEDVPPDVSKAWSIISPSAVFVRPIDKEAKHRHSPPPGHARTESAERLVIGGPLPTMSDEGGADDTHDSCGWEVKLLPPFFVEDSDVSRWTPPINSANPQVYCLTQLLVAMLTNTHPFAAYKYQVELLTVRGGVHVDLDQPDLHGKIRNEELDAFHIPGLLPHSVSQLIGRGFGKHRRVPEPKPRPDGESTIGRWAHQLLWGGISTDVAEDDGPLPFVTIQDFRREVAKVSRSEGISSLPTPDSSSTTSDFGPVEEDISDYGLVSSKPPVASADALNPIAIDIVEGDHIV